MASPNALAICDIQVVTQLVVRRPLSCSCPAQTGFVLGGRAAALRPSALYAPRMRALDDVLSLSQLPVSRRDAAANASLLPVVKCVHRSEEVLVAELERDEEAYGDGPFPMLFFSFTLSVADARAKAQEQPAWRETGVFEYALRQPRSTRWLMIKVVCSEDRMHAMGDDHDEPNIDLEYCGARGMCCPDTVQRK